jgi:hypothetical protein
MKAPRKTRCIAPIIAALPFLAFAFIGIKGSGLHPLPIALGLVGLFGLTVGLYFGICRIEYRDRGFITYPGRKRYELREVVSWSVGEDADAEPGFRRHLEVRFDSWYRRYILFEEGVSPESFNALLNLLNEK